MEIFDILDTLDVLSYVVGIVSAGLVFLIGKLPTKVKKVVVSILDKTDAELDKEKK